MRYLVACIFVVSISFSFGAFTPPDSGTSGNGATVAYVDSENALQNSIIALNTAARTNMGNWTWEQDGTDLIAVYTTP